MSPIVQSCSPPSCLKMVKDVISVQTSRTSFGLCVILQTLFFTASDYQVFSRVCVFCKAENNLRAMVIEREWTIHYITSLYGICCTGERTCQKLFMCPHCKVYMVLFLGQMEEVNRVLADEYGDETQMANNAVCFCCLIF